MDLRASNNLLLRALAPDAAERLAPRFHSQPLDFKQTLMEQNKPITHVYFIESGVASLLTDLAEGESIETGTIGNEGLVGLPAVLGAERASGRAICQIPGRALRLAVDVIASERAAATPWFLLLLRFANFATSMAAQSAACNRRHPVEARMSRWLLMMHDRVDGNDFPLTQEFLGQMLGVARPTVNIAGAMLQKAGFIKYTRGRITILDRAGLESASCECYRKTSEELEDLVRVGSAPVGEHRRGLTAGRRRAEG